VRAVRIASVVAALSLLAAASPRIGAALATAKLASPAATAPGQLDRTFGGDGRVLSAFDGPSQAVSVTLGPGHRYIVVGNTYDEQRSFMHGDIVRYLKKGDISAAFGGGLVTTDFELVACAVQPDGKVVVDGFLRPPTSPVFRLEVARYRANGTLDPSFGSGGRTLLDVPGGPTVGEIAILPHGKILLTSGVSLIRFDPNGAIDTTFGAMGHARAPGFAVTSLAVQPDGKIVVAGVEAQEPWIDLFLARYRPNGTFDRTFGYGGKTRANAAATGSASLADVAIQSTGGIILMGPGRVARYTPKGMLDGSFGENGVASGTFVDPVNDEDLSVAVQTDDRIVVAGFAVGQKNCCHEKFAVARYTRDGVHDRTFGGDGIVVTRFAIGGSCALGMALVPPNRILLVGTAGRSFPGRFALARYLGG